MKRAVEANVTCEIEFGGIEYYVEATARGACYYQAAKLGGPPEDCYPEETECDLYSTKITFARRLFDGVEITEAPLIHKIELALDQEWLAEELWQAFDVLRAAEAQGE